MAKQTRKTTDQEKQVFEYLNELRESGITNMFGASPYIQNQFAIEENESMKLLSLWMNNFNEDCNYDTIEE